jgi:hypothetical protein
MVRRFIMRLLRKSTLGFAALLLLLAALAAGVARLRGDKEGST